MLVDDACEHKFRCKRKGGLYNAISSVRDAAVSPHRILHHGIKAMQPPKGGSQNIAWSAKELQTSAVLALHKLKMYLKDPFWILGQLCHCHDWR